MRPGDGEAELLRNAGDAEVRSNDGVDLTPEVILKEEENNVIFSSYSY